MDNFSKQEAEILRAKYLVALEEGKDKFYLFGQPMLVVYAKYLIEDLVDKKILN